MQFLPSLLSCFLHRGYNQPNLGHVCYLGISSKVKRGSLWAGVTEGSDRTGTLDASSLKDFNLLTTQRGGFIPPLPNIHLLHSTYLTVLWVWVQKWLLAWRAISDNARKGAEKQEKGAKSKGLFWRCTWFLQGGRAPFTWIPASCNRSGSIHRGSISAGSG